MEPNEYRCAVCQQVFRKGLTEEEALVQLEDEWPGFAPEDCDLVCDDCWERIKPPENIAVALRRMALSTEAAVQMEHMLADPTVPAHAGESLQTISAEELVRRVDEHPD